MSTRVLVVDDDRTLLFFLKEFLEREDYDVIISDRGSKALKSFYTEHPDLVVLDVMMPGMDGWEVCARIRELSDTPVILLTAKTSESDKLRGFRLGVDDYITKPFSLAELAARMRAILARTAAQRATEVSTYVAGPLTIDIRKREARMDDRPLDLTPTEFRLLATLARNAGDTISQEDLIAEIWGSYRQGGGSTLRRYIWLLRQKIETDPKQPSRLVTVRGFGYRLENG